MVLILPVEFTCCFRCSTESIKAKVDDLLQSKLPSEAAWTASRDRMLLPTLRRMALMDARLPMRWTELAQTLPPCPQLTCTDARTVRSRLQVRFWELCRMARADFQIYFEKHQGDTFFRDFAQLAESIMTLIASSSRDQMDDDPTYVGLWNQIQLIQNRDCVLQMVNRVAAVRTTRGQVKLWTHYAQTIAKCGALEYALVLAQNTVGRHPSALQAFAKVLQSEIDRGNATRLLVWASTKDARSLLHPLGPDLLRLIALQTHAPEVVLWEDVLREHIEHDVLALI